MSVHRQPRAVIQNTTFSCYTPIVIIKMDIDPAIAGSVALTTITDIVGLLTFLGLAKIFLI